MVVLLRGQTLSPGLTNTDIINELIYEHTTVEPMVVQKLDEKTTLVVFPEGEKIEKICNTLQLIETYLDHRVQIGCNSATPKQVSMGDQLC